MKPFTRPFAGITLCCLAAACWGGEEQITCVPKKVQDFYEDLYKESKERVEAGSSKIDETDKLSNTEKYGKPSSVSVYLDSSWSMSGFALDRGQTGPGSTYTDVLDDIFGKYTFELTDEKLRVFKVADCVVPISAGEANRQASEKAAGFYGDVGGEGPCDRKGRLDSVVSRINNESPANPDKHGSLSIVITDLSLSDQDNLKPTKYLVQKLKDTLTSGHTVGLLAIKSEFKGSVSDERPTFTVEVPKSGSVTKKPVDLSSLSSLSLDEIIDLGDRSLRLRGDKGDAIEYYVLAYEMGSHKAKQRLRDLGIEASEARSSVSSVGGREEGGLGTSTGTTPGATGGQSPRSALHHEGTRGFFVVLIGHRSQVRHFINFLEGKFESRGTARKDFDFRLFAHRPTTERITGSAISTSNRQNFEPHNASFAPQMVADKMKKINDDDILGFVIEPNAEDFEVSLPISHVLSPHGDQPPGLTFKPDVWLFKTSGSGCDDSRWAPLKSVSVEMEMADDGIIKFRVPDMDSIVADRIYLAASKVSILSKSSAGLPEKLSTWSFEKNDREEVFSKAAAKRKQGEAHHFPTPNLISVYETLDKSVWENLNGRQIGVLVIAIRKSGSGWF